MRRHVLTAVALSSWGCAGSAEPHVAVQPLVVAEPVSTTEEPVPEVDGPVDVMRSALDEADRRVDSRWVSVEPSDYSTATLGVQPTLVFGPDAPETEACMERGDCLRLVTYPEREPVDVEVVRVEPAHGDTSRRLTLVPRGELANRWYAVEVTVERDVHEATRVGEVQLARFRPDSAPILTHALLSGRGELELHFSERLVGDLEASQWRLEDGGGPLECAGLGPGGRPRRDARCVRMRSSVRGACACLAGDDPPNDPGNRAGCGDRKADGPVRDRRRGNGGRDAFRCRRANEALRPLMCPAGSVAGRSRVAPIVPRRAFGLGRRCGAHATPAADQRPWRRCSPSRWP